MTVRVAGVPVRAIAAMNERERGRFAAANPASEALAREARRHWFSGVPMHWMLDWGTPFPLFVRSASGARFTDVDGHDYVDFCLGDTGSMFGHSPPPVAEMLAKRGSQGLTLMLPAEDSVAVGAELARRFGLPIWQTATTASDANRFVLRWARGLTGRDKVLVFNGCYHGAVDETFVRLSNGKPVHRRGLIGQVVDLTANTVVVEFNDLDAVEAALKRGDIACVITEPALTNIGMVLPQPGFHAGLRKLTRAHGALLVIDETHTISSGPGGYTRAHGLEPDFLVLGKPVAGGIPCAVYGCTAEMAERMERLVREGEAGHTGMGTTLSGSTLAMAAMRVNLEQVMTQAAYDHMLPLAERLAAGLSAAISARKLPWHVSQVGVRAEFVCAPTPPKNGTEAAAVMHGELEHVVHLFLLNRGVVITPFHNMTLVSPATSAADVDRLVSVLGDCLDELLAD